MLSGNSALSEMATRVRFGGGEEKLLDQQEVQLYTREMCKALEGGPAHQESNTNGSG